jgi:hypothetical protein
MEKHRLRRPRPPPLSQILSYIKTETYYEPDHECLAPTIERQEHYQCISQYDNFFAKPDKTNFFESTPTEYGIYGKNGVGKKKIQHISSSMMDTYIDLSDINNTDMDIDIDIPTSKLMFGNSCGPLTINDDPFQSTTPGIIEIVI